MNLRLFILIGILAQFGCQSPGDWSPDAPVITPLPTLQATITFTNKTGEKVIVRGPIRVTDNERADGLMFRKERLGNDEAMLFVMDRTEKHSFWMRLCDAEESIPVGARK